MTSGVEVDELKDEVERWKRRYYDERDRNQRLQEDVDRLEVKLGAVLEGLTQARALLVNANAPAASAVPKFTGSAKGVEEMKAGLDAVISSQ